MARATRVSAADRRPQQVSTYRSHKDRDGDDSHGRPWGGSSLKVELDKAKAANGTAHTANGLEWHKLEISIWSQRRRDYLNNNVTRAEQELKDTIRHDESRIIRGGAAGGLALQ